MRSIISSVKAHAAHFIRQRIKDATLWVVYPAHYRKAVKGCSKPSGVLFLEMRRVKMPDSFVYMYNTITANYQIDVEYVSLGRNGMSRVELLKKYLECIEKIASSKYLFLNDASNLVSCLDLRPETKVVQLWHGCGAFKKWGMSTADLIFGGSAKELERHPYYKNLDLVTVSSPEVSWAYREAMVLEDTPDVVQAIGVSRTDVFFDSNWLSEASSTAFNLIPQAKDKKVMLYAPTFRGRVARAEAPDELDIPAMKRALGEDYVLIIKHHPFVKELPSIPEDCEDFAFDVSRSLPIDQLIAVSDICISDYSSLVFEYSLFERPMIFFAYDLEEYGDWRGFYYDYDELTPGPVFSSTNQIIDYVQNIEERFDKEVVRAFKQKFMASCDGLSTKRIVEKVFDEGDLVPFTSELPNSDSPDVSIVIPAHNAMPYLEHTLSSIVAQTYDKSRIQCIVVDDGSSDATWDTIVAFQNDYPGLIKGIKLDVASGSPSHPRNVGLDNAVGEYVLFVDADDWLGDEAVEKMLFRARAWGSDILLFKYIGEGGRDVPRSMFHHNDPHVDNLFESNAMRTFGPLKLFRRKLIEDHALRFPKHMPEDISFVIRAYTYADVVSIAADYDYYHCLQYDTGAQESFTTWQNLDSNIAAMTDVFDWMDNNIPKDKISKVILPRLLGRDIVRMMDYISFNSIELNDEQKSFFARARAYADGNPELQKLLEQ